MLVEGLGSVGRRRLADGLVWGGGVPPLLGCLEGSGLGRKPWGGHCPCCLPRCPCVRPSGGRRLAGACLGSESGSGAL